MKYCAVSFALIAGLLACAASAAEKTSPPPELDPRICQQMITYQPDNVNGADYKPGVDVHGKPVVEADLNPVGGKVGTVSFYLTVNLAQYLGIQTPGVPGTGTGNGIDNEAVLGVVTVDKDGRVTFNGQPLEAPAEAALRELCAPKPAAPKQDDNKHNQ